MNDRFLEAWGYFIEILICLLLLIISLMLWDKKDIVSFINTSSSDIASYFSVVMFDGVIAFFWVFYSKSDTKFANWLYKKEAYNVYARAYLWAIGVYFFLTLGLFLSKNIENEYLSLVTYWLLILGIINFYTFIKNIYVQLQLNMEFNRLNR